MGTSARPKFTGPTSFSCHEVKMNGYAVPGAGATLPPNAENFYAAADIVLKVSITHLTKSIHKIYLSKT